MKKQLRRLYFLYRICTLPELFCILFHFFFSRKLARVNPILHRILVFTIACADKQYRLSLSEKQLIRVSGLGKNNNLCLLLRKYTRDLVVFEGFFLSNDYEKFIEQITNKELATELIIDAGANIGCAMLYFHSHFPQAHIICIEPEKSNFEILEKNVAVNQLSDRVSCVRKALWNTNTELALRRIDFSNDGFHVIAEGITHAIIDTVATCTIPELIANQPPVSILKVDIEGAEKIIFTDRQHLHQFLPQTHSLIMEVHPEHIREQTIASILQDFHFDTFVTHIQGQASVILAFRKNI